MNPAAVVAFVLLVIASPRAALSQKCALRVAGTRGATAYQPRVDDPRCEGMYVGLQSEPLMVQPVSFVRGGLRLPDSSTGGAGPSIAHIRPLGPWGEGKPLLVIGRGAESNLNWALDAEVKPGTTFNWNLADVVFPAGLTASQIGIYATTITSPSSRSEAQLVPVEISASGAPPAARPDWELVIRIPGAAAARWWIEGARAVQTAEPMNADGFFRIWLPATLPSGAARLAVTWRPRGQRAFNSVPDLLRLFMPKQ